LTKLTAWPNKLGYSMKVIGGIWELAQMAGFWHASFIPTGEYYSMKYGSGNTYKEAMQNAKGSQRAQGGI
jgi:hypothetical protein